MKFTLRLGEAHYNAAVLGFYYVLHDGELPFKIVNYNDEEDECHGNGIEFDSEILEDFPQKYLKAVINILGKDAPFRQLKDIGNKMNSFDGKAEEAKVLLKESKKYTLYKMTSASYKAAYDIILQTGESFDFENRIAEIKSADDTVLPNLIADTVKKMNEYSDIFIMKDIMYTNIQHFWSGVAFLNKTENKTDYASAYKKSFVKPIEDLVVSIDSGKKRKTSLECCQCSMPVTAGESFSMSWINNMGVDLKRKTSPYWNFNADLVLCPMCNLVFSCLPLGFKTKGSESYFVNKNSSIMDLVRANTYFDNSDDRFGYYQIVRKFIGHETSETAKNEIDNIQVLRRTGDNMSQNILSKDKLKSIEKCKNELDSIITRNYTINGVWHNLFDDTIDNIFNSTNMYQLINQQFAINLSDSKKVATTEINKRYYNYILSLERIQMKVYGNGEVEMDKDKNLIDKGFAAGTRLKNAMLGPDRNENKVKSLSFRLVNTLKCRNMNLFLDIVMRQYLSEKGNMPKELSTAMSNEDDFLTYGYAFLNGLNSYTFKEKDGENKEEATNE